MNLRTGLITLAALVLGAVIALVFVQGQAPSMMMTERASPVGFDSTVALIQHNARAEGWLVPNVLPISKSIEANTGHDIGRLSVVELCHPDFAYGLLADEDHRKVSVMMPCAVSVYEKSDGRTYVSSLNMETLGRLFGGNVEQVMGEVAREDAKILRFLER